MEKYTINIAISAKTCMTFTPSKTDKGTSVQVEFCLQMSCETFCYQDFFFFLNYSLLGLYRSALSWKTEKSYKNMIFVIKDKNPFQSQS
jgi:hypothetical protein